MNIPEALQIMFAIIGGIVVVCVTFWFMGEVSASRKHKRRIELMGLGIRPENIDHYLGVKEHND